MFFSSWAAIGRILVVAPLAYIGLVLLLRVSGKRTLTKLNAFDLVITVSLGSALASIVLNTSTPLINGIVAMATLIGLQFVVTWSSVHVTAFQRLVKAEPTLLLRDGQFLEQAMRGQRVTRDEILAVLRASSEGDPAQVDAVILETDGSFSVLPKVPRSGRTSLADVPASSRNG